MRYLGLSLDSAISCNAALPPLPTAPTPPCPRDLGALLTGVKAAHLVGGWLQREHPQLQDERLVLVGLAKQFHSFLDISGRTLLSLKTSVVSPYAAEQVGPARISPS